jgi:hypothetical protein
LHEEDEMSYKGFLGLVVGVVVAWGMSAAINTAFADGIYQLEVLEVTSEGETIMDSVVQKGLSRDDCIWIGAASLAASLAEHKVKLLSWVSASEARLYRLSTLLQYKDDSRTVLSVTCKPGELT